MRCVVFCECGVSSHRCKMLVSLVKAAATLAVIERSVELFALYAQPYEYSIMWTPDEEMLHKDRHCPYKLHKIIHTHLSAPGRSKDHQARVRRAESMAYDLCPAVCATRAKEHERVFTCKNHTSRRAMMRSLLSSRCNQARQP